MITVLTIRKG